MHAARKQNHNNAALRNQLLSTDIGNIDVRDEPTINQSQQQQQPFQQDFQYQPQQPYHPPASNGFHPSQRFPPHPQQSQYFLQPIPPSMPYAPSSPSSGPRSRRSSIQSNNSSFNMSSMGNFIKNKSKSKFSGGGDDDDDEDGKDVMIDDNGATMSFDDLTTLKDRGRYGGQSSFDSTPIIPTLASPASRPPMGGPKGTSVSNVQYRKQMTAYKKHVMATAGKLNDPRSMSFQGGDRNPYLDAGGGKDPRAMSLQGGGRNPYLGDPRAMSLQGGNPMYDPRAMSLQGGNPYQGGPAPIQGPRTNSMTSGPNPYMNPNQSRSNSLMNQQSSFQQGPRAYSLTSNPYQQQKLQQQKFQQLPQQPHPFNRPPINSNEFQPPHPINGKNSNNNSPKFGPQALGSLPHRNSASNLPLNTRPLSAGQSPQLQQQPQIPVSQQQQQQQQQYRMSQQKRPSSGDLNGFHPPRNSNGGLSNSFSGYNPSTPTIEEAPTLPEHTENEASEDPIVDKEKKSETKETSSPEHHYLADNTLNNNDQFDDSGVTYSDFSASQEKSFIAPNDESTPSPAGNNNYQKKPVNNNLQHLVDDSEFDENDETPSKLPRTKGLPHLSLLKLRDEDSDDNLSNEDTSEQAQAQKPQLQSQGQQPQPLHRVLEPVSETEPAQSYATRNTTPPPIGSNEYSRRNSPTKSPFGTPSRNKMISSPGKSSSSPLKRQAGGDGTNGHKKNPLTTMSISSMSEYSTFSGISDGYDTAVDTESRKKIYQLAENSGTTNDVFVTASQFSLPGNSADNNYGHESRQNSRDYFENKDLDLDAHKKLPDTITEGDSYASDLTPKINEYTDNSVNENVDNHINNQGDATPVIEKQHRLSHSYDPSVISNANDSNGSALNDDSSINSSKTSGSIKKSFKSPKFLQKWSKRRNEKKKNNSFEPVTKPVEIKKSEQNALQKQQQQNESPKVPLSTRELPPTPPTNVNNTLGSSSTGPVPSKGLHIIKDVNSSTTNENKSDYEDNSSHSLDPGIPRTRSLDPGVNKPRKSPSLSPTITTKLDKSGDELTITSQEGDGFNQNVSGSGNTNLGSQPTSASGTHSSYSTNNTIDTEPENEFDDTQDSKKLPVTSASKDSSVSEGTSIEALSIPNGKSVENGVASKSSEVGGAEGSRKLESSFEPEPIMNVKAPEITKRLNLTVDQLGIMEDKSSIVRELELVSKELGDSIRREIELEDQIRKKDIIPSPTFNHHNELRDKALIISKLEASLNEERRKRYIAEEHVLLWENDLKPSSLQLSYENEKLRSELINMNETISKQASEIAALRYDSPKNEDEVDSLTRTNKELETVTIPSLKNEIEVLNNDKKRLLMMTEKFKQLKTEKSELEIKLKEADKLNYIHSKQLEDEIAQMKQKYEQKVNKSSESTNSSPVNNNRLKKTFLTELGSHNNSFDSLKPPSPINGKRINSFSLINVTSPNEK